MEKLKKAKDDLSAFPKLGLTSSGRHIIEILPDESGKGRALKELARHYGIEKKTSTRSATARTICQCLRKPAIGSRWAMQSMS